MVAEHEHGNGASPPVPPTPSVPPLLGNDIAAPSVSAAEGAPSVPPPSAPPPWASPETQAHTVVDPALQQEQQQPPAVPTPPAAAPQAPAPEVPQPATALQAPASTPAPSPPEPEPSAIQPVAEPAAAAQPLAQAFAPPTAALPLTPMPPPPGWYGDIFGNPPRWWDGTVWTEHVLVHLPAAEPAAESIAEDEVELNFLDNALISFSLAPDWVRFVTAAIVAAVLALIGFGLLNGGSDGSDTPDGFIPTTPGFEDPSIPPAPELPVPPGGSEAPEGTTPR